MYISQGYQVQHFGNMDQMTVQMKRGGDFVAIIRIDGDDAALTARYTGGDWAPAMGR
jgi:hypothetical protein